MFKVLFTDMVSQNWQLAARTEVLPRVGEIVNLNVEGDGKVIFVKHFYDEYTTLDYVEVILDWKV